MIPCRDTVCYLERYSENNGGILVIILGHFVLSLSYCCRKLL